MHDIGRSIGMYSAYIELSTDIEESVAARAPLHRGAALGKVMLLTTLGGSAFGLVATGPRAPGGPPAPV